MSKKGKKQKNDEKTAAPINLVLPDNMSQAEMQNLIVSSLLEYDKAKAEREKKAEENDLQARRDLVGYKDYSDRKFIPRVFLTFINRIVVLFRLLFMPKEKIEGDYVTTGLMKFAVSILFAAAKWVFRVFGIYGLISYPLTFVFPNLAKIDIPTYFVYIGFGITALLLSQMFRLASIEVEKLKDHNYVVDIFAAVAALVAIIVSLIIR